MVAYRRERRLRADQQALRPLLLTETPERARAWFLERGPFPYGAPALDRLRADDEDEVVAAA